MKRKGTLLLIVAIVSGVVSLIGAIDAFSEVRMVTLIIVVVGAFGSGAALVSAIYVLKDSNSDDL